MLPCLGSCKRPKRNQAAHPREVYELTRVCVLGPEGFEKMCTELWGHKHMCRPGWTGELRGAQDGWVVRSV